MDSVDGTNSNGWRWLTVVRCVKVPGLGAMAYRSDPVRPRSPQVPALVAFWAENSTSPRNAERRCENFLHRYPGGQSIPVEHGGPDPPKLPSTIRAGFTAWLPVECSGFHPSFGFFAFSQRGFDTILV